MANITKDDVKEYIKNMPVFELAQLIKELEEELGVTAAAPMAAMPMAMPMGVPAGGGAAEPVAEEKTEFDVVITGVGDKKIQVIKVVRAITGLGLKEAKQLVDELPGKVKEAIPKEEAANIAKQLEEAGATVEVK
ncbi:MAG: ribosomal protein / ribosomal protein [Deltaproteobacteria bacterium]|jgi:large subunit ribosomal protein L7/L12|nr:ribosomal protein / ribosomal protein [Deltaproteobacteria bacterium]